MLAIIVGNLIGAALVGVMSAMGPRSGMAQIPAARLPFGKSIVVPGVINWLSTIAWDAINAFFGAYAVDAITGGAIPFPVGLLLVIVLQAALSVIGYEAIHTFERYAAVGLAILFAIVTVALLPKATFGGSGSSRDHRHVRPRDDDRRQLQPRLGPLRLGLQPLPARRDAAAAGLHLDVPRPVRRARPGSRSSASPSSARSARRRTPSTRSTPCWAAGSSARSR